MTIEGAIVELQNLIKAKDVPFYYNGAIQKVIETITDECKLKVGKWIKNERGLKCCSICGERPLEVLYYDINFHGYMGKELLSNYCPYCGTKMAGDK